METSLVFGTYIHTTHSFAPLFFSLAIVVLIFSKAACLIFSMRLSLHFTEWLARWWVDVAAASVCCCWLSELLEYPYLTSLFIVCYLFTPLTYGGRWRTEWKERVEKSKEQKKERRAVLWTTFFLCTQISRKIRLSTSSPTCWAILNFLGIYSFGVWDVCLCVCMYVTLWRDQNCTAGFWRAFSFLPFYL